MIVTIHQPDFIPWRGFFDRLRQADLFVVLDDVQFLRRGWHHRDRIKTQKGPAWLTVPTLRKGRFHQLIRDVRIDNSSNWRRKHLGLIRASYAKAPCFEENFTKLEAVYGHCHELLMDLCMDLIYWAMNRLCIETKCIFSSDLNAPGTGTERLVNICAEMGADTYLTGTGSKDYLDESLFAKAGMKVRWQQIGMQPYPQLHGVYEPDLSILDYLMMQGSITGETAHD